MNEGGGAATRGSAPPGAVKVVVVAHGPVTDPFPDVPGLHALSILRPHPDEVPVHPDEVAAVLMAWLDAGVDVDLDSWLDGPGVAYRVDERVRLDRDTDGSVVAGPPAIVQCSFVRRLPSLSRTRFAAYWHDVHAPLVPVHHPGVARYVQNVVVAPLTADAPEVDGIAQLYFRTVDDLRDRYYDSDAGRRRVHEDVARFIDRPAGWRMLAEETWLGS